MRAQFFIIFFLLIQSVAYANVCSSLQKTFHELDISKQKAITHELKSICSLDIKECSDEKLQVLINKYKDINLSSLVQPRYEFENARSIQGDLNSPGVYWFKGKEREQFRAETYIKDGTLKPEYKNSKGIFVLDYKGDLYMHFEPMSGKIHHSSIAEGLPVQSAGEVIIKDGKIDEIVNRSGHYRPGEESLIAVFAKLKEIGLTKTNEEYKRTVYMGLESIWNLKEK